MKAIWTAMVATALMGCAHGTDEGDHELDPEAGLEFSSGKADALGLTVAEIDTILQYVNQPFQDANAFERELDTEIHKRAAEGIVAFRVGPDGRAGTSDDRRFASVEELDAVPYVGRAAARGLRHLAANAGLSSGPSCEEVLGWGSITILDLGRLRQFRDSGCTHVAGNLHVLLEHGTLLPRRDRDLHHLHDLQSVGGTIKLEINVPDVQLELPRLQTAWAVHLDIADNNAVHLPALTSVHGLQTRQAHGSVVSAPGVESLDTLSVQMEGATLELGSLESVTSLALFANSQAASFDLDRVAQVGSLNVRSAAPISMPDLESAEGNVLLDTMFDLPRLATVGGSVTFGDRERPLAEVDLPSLVSIGDSLTLRGVGGTGSFAELRSVKTLDIDVTCEPGAVDLESLSEVDHLEAWLRGDCDGVLAELEEVDGDATLWFVDHTAGLSHLERVGGRLQLHDRTDGSGLLPDLSWVQELTFWTRTGEGLNALESVEGHLRLNSNELVEINGLSRLRAVGGNIYLDTDDLTDAAYVEFIDQLASFTGRVYRY